MQGRYTLESKQKMLFCEIKGVQARGHLSPNGLVVQELLCIGCNWAMGNQKAFRASLISIKKYSSDVSLLKQHALYTTNYLAEPEKIIAEYKSYVTMGQGPIALWWLYIADENI